MKAWILRISFVSWLLTHAQIEGLLNFHNKFADVIHLILNLYSCQLVVLQFLMWTGLENGISSKTTMTITFALLLSVEKKKLFENENQYVKSM